MAAGRPRTRAKDRRPLSQAEIQSVYRTGSRHVTPVATVYVLRRVSPRSRLAVPVGKRIGTAVVRNRVRRRLRAAFQQAGQEMTSGGDVIIVARTVAASVSFQALVHAIRGALQQSGLIQP